MAAGVEEAAHAGWLEARALPDSSGDVWLRLWCVLTAQELAFFEDSNCVEKQGYAPVSASTCPLSFISSQAPKAAARLGQARPFGFVLPVSCGSVADSGFGHLLHVDVADASSSGSVNDVHLLYFDASCADDSEAWVAAFSRVALALDGEAADRDAEEAEAAPAEPRTAEVRAVEIDDFSDYEDDSHCRRSSLEAGFESCDWVKIQTTAEDSRGKDAMRHHNTANFEIDDFSDYDDEEEGAPGNTAKRSSLKDGYSQDWSGVLQARAAAGNAGDVDADAVVARVPGGGAPGAAPSAGAAPCAAGAARAPSLEKDREQDETF